MSYMDQGIDLAVLRTPMLIILANFYLESTQLTEALSFTYVLIHLTLTSIHWCTYFCIQRLKNKSQSHEDVKELDQEASK